jgi:hypothetical protein
MDGDNVDNSASFCPENPGLWVNYAGQSIWQKLSVQIPVTIAIRGRF